MQAGRADLVVAPPPSFSPELPGPRSGLGATELRISDLLDGGRGAKHALINRVVYRDWSIRAPHSTILICWKRWLLHLGRLSPGMGPGPRTGSLEIRAFSMNFIRQADLRLRRSTWIFWPAAMIIAVSTRSSAGGRH
jgi:hypothetical protein